MKTKPKASVVLSTQNYLAEAVSREHSYTIDLAEYKGGANKGPTPVEYFLAAIGGCVAITLRMYAEKMKWDLGEINVQITEETKLVASGIQKNIIEEILIEKKVTNEQLQELKEIAKQCPVAQMVKNETKFSSTIKNK